MLRVKAPPKRTHLTRRFVQISSVPLIRTHLNSHLFHQAKSGKTEEKEAETSAEKLSTINIGDSLPTLTLKNEKGEDIQIGELANEKGVVLFLVPKADTRAFLLCLSINYPGSDSTRAFSLSLFCIFHSRMHDPGVWLP